MTLSLKQKIHRDALEYLGQEYKIHLQPKPEYQLPVLKILAEMIATDDALASHIEAWKAIIPYHRVTTDLNLPAIVIYPVWGRNAARIVLKKIVDVFSQFDSKHIGLNHTPRFNYKVNSLIYYAGGSGDQKKELPVEYFASAEKIFYRGHELYL